MERELKNGEPFVEMKGKEKRSRTGGNHLIKRIVTRRTILSFGGGGGGEGMKKGGEGNKNEGLVGC